MNAPVSKLLLVCVAGLLLTAATPALGQGRGAGRGGGAGPGMSRGTHAGAYHGGHRGGGARHGTRHGAGKGHDYGKRGGQTSVTRTHGYGLFHGSMTARVHPRGAVDAGGVQVHRGTSRPAGHGAHVKPRRSREFGSSRSFESRRFGRHREPQLVGVPVVRYSSSDTVIIIVNP